MTIRLSIQRLIIDDIGVPPEDIRPFKMAVESALAARLEGVGAAALAQSTFPGRRVDGGSISIAQGSGPDDIAQKIGDALISGISK